MEKATRMARVRTSQGVSVISGSISATCKGSAMGQWGGEYEPSGSPEGNQNAGSVSSLTPPTGVCCLKLGQQFREPVDHADAQAFETGAVLVAVGGQYAVDAHRRGGFGVVRGITNIDHVLRAMRQVG